MKLNVEKVFCDKFTKNRYAIGDVIEVDAARGKELLADPRKLVSLSDNSTAKEPEGETAEAKKKPKKKAN